MADEYTPALRLGMVGGGRDAFIGAVHRMAARLDNKFELVAGALSSTPDKALASGRDLGLDEKRIYHDYKEMAIREARLATGIEVVAIVTPNHLHAPIALEFLRRKIHVICDKPLTATMAQAKKIYAAAKKAEALFVLTHNYTGYPLVRTAREMVAAGDLGDIRVVQVEYPQDWLSEQIEDSGHKQAAWRVDPERSGAGGCIGDIGTHAYNLARFVTQLKLDSLFADLSSFGAGRKVDDNANVMLRFVGGATGMLWSSQVAPGNENALRLRVYGTKAGLSWEQEHPNQLWFAPLGEPKRMICRGNAGSGAAAGRVTRLPPGHPEGYVEAFATIYNEAAAAIEAFKQGAVVAPEVDFPGIDDGLEGVAFIDACVRSSKAGGRWLKLGV